MLRHVLKLENATSLVPFNYPYINFAQDKA